uniref:DNA-directed RNA polymerase n=1 Tax=Haemonchus contortus TaxID=6289 RepID=A0A912MM53_HAECO
ILLHPRCIQPAIKYSLRTDERNPDLPTESNFCRDGLPSSLQSFRHSSAVSRSFHKHCQTWLASVPLVLCCLQSGDDVGRPDLDPGCEVVLELTKLPYINMEHPSCKGL